MATPGTTVTMEDLRDFAAQRLARFKLPRALEVIDAVPRDSNGTVKKPRVAQAVQHPKGSHPVVAFGR